MNPEDLLSQLRDIHTPDPIGWWPPALGWWCLLLLCGLAVLAWRWWSKVLRKSLWRKQAREDLNQACKAYSAQPDSAHLTALVSLVKRIIATSQNDHSILTTSDVVWRKHLAQHFQLTEHDLDILVAGHYQPQPPALSDAALIALRKGIRELGK